MFITKRSLYSDLCENIFYIGGTTIMLREHTELEKLIEKILGYEINFVDKLNEYHTEQQNGKDHKHVVLTSCYYTSNERFYTNYEGMVHVNLEPSHPKIILIVVADNGALFYWDIYRLVKETLPKQRVTIDFFGDLSKKLNGLSFKSSEFYNTLTRAIKSA